MSSITRLRRRRPGARGERPGREGRIGEHAQAVELDQHSRVADEGDPQAVNHSSRAVELPEISHSSDEIANAMAKPSVVKRPTSLPPRSKASGIIVSASIVKRAPAANDCTKATAEGDPPLKKP